LSNPGTTGRKKAKRRRGEIWARKPDKRKSMGRTRLQGMLARAHTMYRRDLPDKRGSDRCESEKNISRKGVEGARRPQDYRQ